MKETKKKLKKWTLTTSLGHRTTSFRGRIQQCSCNRTGLIDDDDNNKKKKKALSPPLLLLYTRIDSAPGNNFSKSSSAPDAYRIQSNSPLDPNLLHAPTLYSHPSMLPAARAECTSSVVIIGAAALEPKLPVRLTTNHGQSQLLQWLS